MDKIEMQYTNLNEIYYDLYQAFLFDKITEFEWENVKQSIWELKDKLKIANEKQENTTNK